MKYLLVEIKKTEADIHTRMEILEEAMRAYEKAKQVKDNKEVYLTAILKEIDL